jgi:ElaB/YqjD/DUF883 family membrane-anchored ribosome-binding protein
MEEQMEQRKEAAFENAKEQISDAADRLKAKSREAWEYAKEKSHEKWEDARAQGEQFWDDTQRIVQKHPGRALAISFLAGAVIGALLFSREND